MTIKSSTVSNIDTRIKKALFKSFSNRWQYANLFNIIFNLMMIFFINPNIFSILAFTLSVISFFGLINNSYNSYSYEKRISDKKCSQPTYECMDRYDYDGEKHY